MNAKAQETLDNLIKLATIRGYGDTTDVPVIRLVEHIVNNSAGSDMRMLAYQYLYTDAYCLGAAEHEGQYDTTI